VATGKLAPDEQLPSVRAQAERLVINPNTVARAYNELVQAGIARSHQGRGLFVNGRRTIYKKAERQRRLEPALDAFVNEAIALGFTTDQIVEEVRRKLSRLDMAPRESGVASDE
jgi:GntR family transcriptional regulator